MTGKLYKRYISSAINAVGTMLIFLSAGVGLWSCSDNLELNNPADELQADCITLTLKCGQNVSRAEEPGIDELNENRIHSVTLCLSPSAGDRTDSANPAYMQTFTDLNADNEVVLRLPLTTEMITRLFGENSSNQCRVFAAVNVDPGTATTVEQLRKMTVTSTFESSRKQKSFTMDGDGVINYTPGRNSATGSVTVKRSAAKITLALDVDEEVEEDIAGKKLHWEPNLEGMKVRLVQGVKTSQLDPAPAPDMDASVYFNTPDNIEYKFKVEGPEGDKYARYNQKQDMPFYTYPNKWTGSLGERHGTFMILSVPWSSDDGKSWRTCYYHVPIIPDGNFELVRNTSYHVFLHVGILGSFVPDEPLEVMGDYYVADWGQEKLDVDIKDYRYLVVDQNDYVVNNEASITIPFYTSHETVVTDVKMKFYRYNFSDQGSEFAVTVSKAQNDLSAAKSESKTGVYTCDFDNSKNTLYLSHTLNIWAPYNNSDNEVLLTRKVDGTTRADVDNTTEIQAVLNTIAYFKEKLNDGEYSRIEYEVTVQHKDVFDGSSHINKDLYKETVTITQYPGMYITAVQNYCDNLKDKTKTNAISGNTFINGNTNGDNFSWPVNGLKDNNFNLINGDPTDKGIFRRIFNYQNWDRSIGLGFPPAYLNWNPNLYLVTITQLSQELGNKYIIDDPRSYNINNYLSNNTTDYTVDGGTQNVFKDEYFYFSDTDLSMQSKNEPINPQPVGTTLITLKGFIKAPALGESEERTLKYYYPTREAEENKKTIAPKFRICSSYAGSSGFLTREMSRRRAAAYQELGYPAGRWRLPTFGEVEYIMTLAAEQKIPRLFGTQASGTWYYWCAQGAVKVPDANNSNQTIEIVKDLYDSGGTTFYEMPLIPFSGDQYLARTRFVYDEWYWGSETLTPKPGDPNANSTIYTFTWGDRKKDNPEE